MSKPFYAVRVGKIPGIYRTWDECKEQVTGYSGSVYKKFKSEEEANEFIKGESASKNKEETEHIVTCNDDELIAYVDGSYNIKDKSFSYGAVIFNECVYEENSQRFNTPGLADMRNVAGEIFGSEFAINRAIELGYKKLYLHYDYEGIKRWALGDWRTNKDGTKSYKEFYDSVKDEIDVDFIKVKSHSGVEFNERADVLAKEALFIEKEDPED